jgi:hypothetical protein
MARIIRNNEIVDQVIEENPTEIIIYKGNENEPLIKVTSFTDIKLNQSSLTEINGPISNVLYPLFQQIPSFASSLKNSSQKLFKVIVDKSLAKGILDGTFDLANSKELIGAYRGNIINTKTGKIVGQGNLKPIPKLEPAAVVAGIFQFLSIITAQKFLSDIDKKLGIILMHVEQLKKYFQNEWYGKIVGNIKYLGCVVKKIENGFVNDNEKKVILNSLEYSKRESFQLYEILNKNRSDHYYSLINNNYNGSGLKNNAIKFKNDIREYFHYTTLTDNLLLYLISLNAGKNLFTLKKQSIKCDNDELILTTKEYKTLLDKEKDEIKRKAASIKGHPIFGLDNTEKQYQNDLVVFFNSYNSTNINTICEINKLTEIINTKLEEMISSGNLNELLIEIDNNNNISKIYSINDNDKK